MLSKFITYFNNVLLGILMIFLATSSVLFYKNCEGVEVFQKAHYKNTNHNFTKKDEIFRLSGIELSNKDCKDNIVHYFEFRNIKTYYHQNIPNNNFTHQTHKYNISLYDLYCNWQFDY